jgi:hypothetical protein
MRHRRVAGIGLCVAGLVGCAAGGVSFSGKGQPQVVDSRQIGVGDRAPDGQRRLGRLAADCTPVEATEGLDGARLSDLTCSQPFLMAALKERAASAGGAFLVEPRCVGRGKSPDAALRCSAEVWGPVEVASFVAPEDEPRAVNVDPRAPAVPGAPPLGRVAEAWRVRVDFWPTPGQQGRPAVDPAEVAEIDFERVGQVTLGDLRAHCDADCSLESVRVALRAAAGRIGATSLVGVRCIEEEGAPSCVASVTLLASNGEPRGEAY